MTNESSAQLDGLARLWRGYAKKVYGEYSPLYSALAGAVADNPELLELIRGCPPHAHDPNMLMASIHFMVLDGVEHPLAQSYGESGPVPDDTAALLQDFCQVYRDPLVRLMSTRRIQTNEVGRSPALALGLAGAASEIGQPLALIDDGASAGLNLAVDQYLLDFGTAGTIGPGDSTVRVRCDTRGSLTQLPRSLPVIERRVGIDRQPIDLTDATQVRWLLACIWPGTGRRARTESAINLATSRLAAGAAPWVREGDMVDDLGEALAQMRPLPTVVMTSWSYSYLLPEQRKTFQQVLQAEGHHHPVAWVCCDGVGVVPMFDPGDGQAEGESIPSTLGLAVYSGGQPDVRVLAYVHSHGSWIQWLDG